MSPLPPSPMFCPVMEQCMSKPCCPLHSQQLGMRQDQAQFYTSPILQFQAPVPPDVVLALHACDTATDEALALGIKLVR